MKLALPYMTRTSLRPPLDRVRDSNVTMAVTFAPGRCATHVADRSPDRVAATVATGDVFSMSWSRRAGEAFRGYDELWSSFADALSEFLRSLPPDGPRPSITGCRLSYLNPVTAEEGWHHRYQLERLLLQWLGRELSGEFLPRPDDLTANATFRFPEDSGGGPAGTLTITLESIPHEGPEPLTGMTLCASGAVQGPGLAPAKAFFDTAFEWVVRGFASLAPTGLDEHRPRRRAPKLFSRS